MPHDATLIAAARLVYRTGMAGRVRVALIGVVALAVVAAAWLMLRGGAEPPAVPRPISRAPATARPAPTAAAPQAPLPTKPELPPTPAATAAADIPAAADLGGEIMVDPWNSVDLEEVRKALPDNLYWKVAAPTTDPEVIEQRDAERAEWNVQYGKVLSGTASDEEIRAYYDQRAHLSGDYIEFTTYLLDHYGDGLADRDVGLLQLARRLHQARLEEIPRKLEEAFERKRQQDAAREAWQADERAFHGDEDGGSE